MRLLARPSAVAYGMLGHPRLGLFVTPRGMPQRARLEGVVWAADNDAFAGFHEGRFVSMLRRIAGLPNPPAWVACPDVVADAGATLALFDRWEPVIRDYGLRVALVAQDGLTPAVVPWVRADCLFVGGTTNAGNGTVAAPVSGWKVGPEARALVATAKSLGKWVHMGRCSTLARIRVAVAWGCDSIDSSCTATLPGVWVPKILRWVGRCESVEAHPSLFDAEG